MSSFQGVGTEEFHCIQRCPHFRGWNRGVPLYTELSSFQGVGIEVSSFQGLGVPLDRDVLISECWNRGVPLYTEVSSFQAVVIEEFHW